MLHKLRIAHLRDVNQAVLMNADIHKCAKVDDVADGSFQNHARFQVLHCQNIRTKHRFGHIASRIPSRLLQLGSNINQCLISYAKLPGKALSHFSVLHPLTQSGDPAAGDICQSEAEFLQQAKRGFIGLRMHACHIQRILSAPDPQESGTLLVSLRPQARNLQKLLSVRKCTVLIPPRNNGAGSLFRDPRDIFQQGIGCRIQIDTDLVDAALDNALQLLAQLLLVTVMLILADSDGLRVDLDQLCQRILQAARNRSCTSLPYIKLREFLRRQFAGGIDGSACLIDNHILHLLRNLRKDLRNDLLRFTRCCPVSAGNERNMILIDQPLDGPLRSFDLCRCGRSRRIDDCGIQNLSGAVHNRKLAACTKRRIPSENNLSRDRRLHQQLTQIFAEYINRPVFRSLGQRTSQFPLDGRRDQSPISIRTGLLQCLNVRHLVFGRSSLMCMVPAFRPDDKRFNGTNHLLFVDTHGNPQDLFFLSPVQRKNPVARDLRCRFLIVEILRIYRIRLIHILPDFRYDHAQRKGLLPDLSTDLSTVGDTLSDDILCSLQRSARILYFLFRIHKVRGSDQYRNLHLLLQDLLCQRLQSAFPCNGRPRSSFRTIWKIQILQRRLRCSLFNLFFQFRCQLPLLFDRSKDDASSLLEGSQIAKPLIQAAQLFIIQATMRFLSVPGNERDGVSLVDQLHDCLHLPGFYLQFRCDCL